MVNDIPDQHDFVRNIHHAHRNILMLRWSLYMREGQSNTTVCGLAYAVKRLLCVSYTVFPALRPAT